jgi:hypothetical protein
MSPRREKSSRSFVRGLMAVLTLSHLGIRCETEWEDFKEKRRSEKKKEEESEEEEGKESHPTPIESNECKEAEVEVEAKKCLPEPNSSDEIPTESAESLNGSSARSQGRKPLSQLGEIFGEEHIS